MPKKLVIIVFLVVVLLLGCGKPKPIYPSSEKDYRKGTEGLTFQFMKNGPPDKVYEKDSFEIALEVWNKGAYDIEWGYIAASLERQYMCVIPSGGTAESACIESQSRGLQTNRDKKATLLKEIEALKLQQKNEPERKVEIQQEIAKKEDELTEIDRNIREQENRIGTENKELTKRLENLKGRSPTAPIGTQQFMTFSAKSLPLDLLSEQHTSQAILTACYGYVTMLAEDVCIDPDPTGIKDIDKACTIKPITLKDQGGPLAITGIETKILPHGESSRVQFVITVENKGTGQVVNREKLLEACTSGKLNNDDWNRVTISELGFDAAHFYKKGEEGNTMTCDNNPIRLTTNKATFRCQMDQNLDGISRSAPPFTAQLFVRLDYGYMDSITKSVIVEKVR